MKISLRWLSGLLSRPLPDAITAEALLMGAGFPIDSATYNLGDVLLDVEITSNRGDCLSHLGLAREVVAKDPTYSLRPPSFTTPPHDPTPAGLSLRVEDPACPRFTARVIRGVKVGPSPDWLRTALESVGQRSINNVVDVTNFITFELGNPCHVFDLAKLAGQQLVVRWAKDAEPLTTLDGKKRTLRTDELVVADAHRAQSLAGVIGGQDSEVGPNTTDVVLEVATWDPVTVRRASRRHQVRTDASHRFERIVDARTLEDASNRAAALILEVAGGRISGDMLSAGAPLPAPVRIRFRPGRVKDLLGIEVSREECFAILARLDITVEPVGRAGDEFVAAPPPYRPDLTREVDLIEEVARIKGLEAIPVAPRMTLSVRGPQASETARREISSTLTGLGFYEAVTFSFCARTHAAAFMPTGMRAVEVDDERRAHEPALRPSVAIGLLGGRRVNRNARVQIPGGVRLFEVGSVFAEDAAGKSVENLNVALLLDCPFSGKAPTVGETQSGVRAMRGAIAALARAIAGPLSELSIDAATPHCPAFSADGYARLSLNGAPLGYMGTATPEVLAAFDLETPVAIAELSLSALIAGYPGRSKVEALPAFPSIERDISFIVPEAVAYAQIEAGVHASRAQWLEGCGFVGTYRGKQVGAGRKSVTLRLVFRDASRTLRHDEVDAPAAAVISHLKGAVGAEVREN
ncbi:MAG: phenylalanine--tRNA ligase subunit beta [Phycisphaerales bacterium]